MLGDICTNKACNVAPSVEWAHSELKSAQRDTNLRAGCTKAAQMLKQAEPHSCTVNGNGKVILDTHPESDQHQNQTSSRGSPPAPTHRIWWWFMNPFLRYLADKNSAHRQTDRQTDTRRWPQDLAAYGAQVKICEQQLARRVPYNFQ